LQHVTENKDFEGIGELQIFRETVGLKLIATTYCWRFYPNKCHFIETSERHFALVISG